MTPEKARRRRVGIKVVVQRRARERAAHAGEREGDARTHAHVARGPLAPEAPERSDADDHE